MWKGRFVFFWVWMQLPDPLYRHNELLTLVHKKTHLKCWSNSAGQATFLENVNRWHFSLKMGPGLKRHHDHYMLSINNCGNWWATFLKYFRLSGEGAATILLCKKLWNLPQLLSFTQLLTLVKWLPHNVRQTCGIMVVFDLEIAKHDTGCFVIDAPSWSK